MKIAMIIEAWTPIWGGGQAVAFELSKKLTENHPCNVDLFVMDLDKNRNLKTEQISKNFQIIYTGSKKRWTITDRIFWIFELILEILKKNKKEKYDLIYAHANLPGLPAKLISFLLKIPVVYQVHGSGIDSITTMYGTTWKSKFLKFFESFLQKWIKYDLEFTVDKKFIESKNINTPIFIPNGVDVNRFDSISKSQNFEKKFKILFVGRLHPQKGLNVLIDTVNQIQTILRNKNCKVTIVGGGYEKDELLNKVNSKGLDDIFEFVGKKYGNELVLEYKSSNLFVLPSYYEGFPLVILEAWASKLPVLVTSVGENPEIIDENIDGWLVDPGNTEELIKKFKLILSINTEELEKIGYAGYSKVKKNYSWDAISEKLYEKISEILKS
ncbi:putative glycosyl transferase [Methanococcus maripaludis KA1]|uniref:Putative glycosyl transferase n=1 Tax=Methanococcus maripaludis KA1 TaxID=637914 RepID=A0A2Z5PR19_METMI|nr:glycosyltransferase family 4 protein [Methanococcus maripaludis]BAP61377.1 putative glycosyl transferase [Methanococcus maripaludis KA1]